MALKGQSNEQVIQSGLSELSSLQKHGYLHNYQGNYEAIGGEFEDIDILIMDALYKKLIDKQKAEEQVIYQILEVKNIDELNEKYFNEAGKDNSLLQTDIADIFAEASKKAFSGENVTRNKSNENAFASAVETTMQEMLEKEYGMTNPELIKQLSTGLGINVATKLAKQFEKKKGKSRYMNKYISDLANKMRSQWKGDILEQETAIVMQRLVNGLKGRRGSVVITGETKRNGKSIKADDTIIIDNNFTIGISAKNYQLPKNGKQLEITLHSAGSLKNFYNLIENMQLNGESSVDISAMKSLAKEFQSPYFKYHLINQAAFAGTKKISNTDVGQNMLKFIKYCLPLFMGTQLKIEGDKVNVDFFNINGKLIPASEIMEQVFINASGYGTRINLYSNYQVPWVEMRSKKLGTPLEGIDYYSQEVQQIGGFYGNNLYGQVNVGRIHLRMALAKLK